MKGSLGIAALLASEAGMTAAVAVAKDVSSQKLCQGTSREERGNWYCQPVHRIIYENVGTAGQYSDVVGMDQDTGVCRFGNRSYSGPLAPFNEPVRSSSVRTALPAYPSPYR